MSLLCHNEIIDIYQCSSAHKLQPVIVTVILRGGSQLQRIKWIDYQVYIFSSNLTFSCVSHRTELSRDFFFCAVVLLNVLMLSCVYLGLNWRRGTHWKISITDRKSTPPPAALPGKDNRK